MHGRSLLSCNNWVLGKIAVAAACHKSGLCDGLLSCFRGKDVIVGDAEIAGLDITGLDISGRVCESELGNMLSF